MAHGYYNLQGTFVTTATKAAATAAWREERGYNPIGVFDMGGGEVVDTRREEPAPAPAPAPTPAATLADTFAGDVQGIQSLAQSRFAEVTPRAGVAAPTTDIGQRQYDLSGRFGTTTPPVLSKQAER